MKTEIKSVKQWAVVNNACGDILGQLRISKAEAKSAAESTMDMTWKEIAGAGYSLVEFNVSPVKNKAAQSLGRLAAGKPKKFSAEEIAKRTARLAEARAARRNQVFQQAKAKGVEPRRAQNS